MGASSVDDPIGSGVDQRLRDSAVEVEERPIRLAILDDHQEEIGTRQFGDVVETRHAGSAHVS